MKKKEIQKSFHHSLASPQHCLSTAASSSSLSPPPPPPSFSGGLPIRILNCLHQAWSSRVWPGLVCLGCSVPTLTFPKILRLPCLFVYLNGLIYCLFCSPSRRPTACHAATLSKKHPQSKRTYFSTLHVPHITLILTILSLLYITLICKWGKLVKNT